MTKDDFNLCDSSGTFGAIQQLLAVEGFQKQPGGEQAPEKPVFLYSPMTKAATDTIENLDKTLQEFYRQLCNKNDTINYSVGKSFMKNPYQRTCINVHTYVPKCLFVI